MTKLERLLVPTFNEFLAAQLAAQTVHDFRAAQLAAIADMKELLRQCGGITPSCCPSMGAIVYSWPLDMTGISPDDLPKVPDDVKKVTN